MKKNKKNLSIVTVTARSSSRSRSDDIGNQIIVK